MIRAFVVALIACLCAAGCVYAEENVTSEEVSEVEQVLLYEGNVTLPEGNVTVEASSGTSYEFPAATPMGALVSIATDANLSVSIGDKPMAHKGILALDQINDYSYSANNTWFVEVNEYQLQEYVVPATDGMNIYTVKPGDVLAFYYGLPIKPVEEAQAKILLTIE
jgi:hypothetical protein